MAATPRVAPDPRCRYCGLLRSDVLARLGGDGGDPRRCPLDGHRYPPAKPDCLGCAGACVACEGGDEGLPCPRCGRAGPLAGVRA